MSLRATEYMDSSLDSFVLHNIYGKVSSAHP